MLLQNINFYVSKQMHVDATTENKRRILTLSLPSCLWTGIFRFWQLRHLHIIHNFLLNHRLLLPLLSLHFLFNLLLPIHFWQRWWHPFPRYVLLMFIFRPNKRLQTRIVLWSPKIIRQIRLIHSPRSRIPHLL